MEYLSVLSGVGIVWFLVVTIPGPNFIVVTQTSMAHSRKMGIGIALGVSIGASLWASASMIGLSALFAYAGWLYDALKLIGGCYLIYMGLKTIYHVMHRTTLVAEVEKTVNGGSAIRKGVLTSLSNPKTAAFFGGLFLASFPTQAPLWLIVTTVGMIFVISLIWYCTVVYIFSFGWIQTFYKNAKRSLDMVTGVLLSYLGAKLIFGRT